MGMTITTSKTGAFDDWIYDPATEDGDALGLSMSGGAMGICDTLNEIGIDGDISDQAWPLAEIKPRLDAKLADPEAAGCDYLGPKLQKLSAVIAAGEARGAQFLTAS